MSVFIKERVIVIGDRVINPNRCDHDSDPQVCFCLHDWRIHWGNVERTS